jgi:probable HAF family extracellular repeat protein
MRRFNLISTLALLSLVCALSAVPRAQIATTFEPLGLAPAGFASVQSEAWDASADGAVVIGEFWEPKNGFFLRHGFRWQASTGMRDLGALNPQAIEVQPLAVSDDGSRVVGWARGKSGFQRPFLWTAATGMQELVQVPGTDAIATDISSDGHVIVGHFFDQREQAFLWRDGVVTPLGFLGAEPDSFARGVCAQGNVVVGSTQSAGGRAFRWTPTTGMKDLGSLSAGSPSYAQACSDDGSIAVGVSGNGKGLPPVRWAPSARSLGTLGGDSGEANAISGSGAVIVGDAGLPFVNGISEFAAFRWTADTRIQQLSRVLEARGVSTPFCHNPSTCPAATWFLQFALGLSSNGQVIVGAGVNPDNDLEAYRAVVP